MEFFHNEYIYRVTMMCFNFLTILYVSDASGKLKLKKISFISLKIEWDLFFEGQFGSNYQDENYIPPCMYMYVYVSDSLIFLSLLGIYLSKIL